jgi:hypothetical protein
LRIVVIDGVGNTSVEEYTITLWCSAHYFLFSS